VACLWPAAMPRTLGRDPANLLGQQHLQPLRLRQHEPPLECGRVDPPSASVWSLVSKSHAPASQGPAVLQRRQVSIEEVLGIGQHQPVSESLDPVFVL
jgi:hypothetical protein